MVKFKIITGVNVFDLQHNLDKFTEENNVLQVCRTKYSVIEEPECESEYHSLLISYVESPFKRIIGFSSIQFKVFCDVNKDDLENQLNNFSTAAGVADILALDYVVTENPEREIFLNYSVICYRAGTSRTVASF